MCCVRDKTRTKSSNFYFFRRRHRSTLHVGSSKQTTARIRIVSSPIRLWPVNLCTDATTEWTAEWTTVPHDILYVHPSRMTTWFWMHRRAASRLSCHLHFLSTSVRWSGYSFIKTETGNEKSKWKSANTYKLINLSTVWTMKIVLLPPPPLRHH